MVERLSGDTRGFSLVEALIATVLGTLVIALVVSVVVAQGGYFGDVHARANLQETVRSSAEILREELQTVLRGGILTAESDRLVVLVPVAMGVICGEVEGPTGKGTGKGKGNGKGKGPVTAAPAYLPLPGGGADTDRVTWYAIRDEGGEWLFNESDPVVTGGNPAGDCEDVGADTDGAKADFRNLSGFQSPALPEVGNLVALLSEVGFRFDDSALGPGTIALYRREAGGTEVEFSSGLSSDARFQYRRQGQTTFQDQVTSAADRATIVEIRVLAEARSLDERGGAGALTYGWDLRIPLRNVP